MSRWVARVRDAGRSGGYAASGVYALDWIKAHHAQVMAAEALRPSNVLGMRADQTLLNAENRIICAGEGVTEAMKSALVEALAAMPCEKAAQMVDDWFTRHMQVVHASAARTANLAR